VGHVRGDRVSLYLTMEDRRTLDTLLKMRRIVSASALFRNALAEVSAGIDPKDELRKIEEQEAELRERKKVYAECAHTKSSRFLELQVFLEKYCNFCKTAKTAQQTRDWLDGWRKELQIYFGEMAALEIKEKLDILIASPDLSQAKAEGIIGRPL